MKKTKTIKAKEALNYSMKEALNLVGKKMQGEDWLFEDHKNKRGSKDYERYLRTLGAINSLVNYCFFDVFKEGGENFKRGEELFFFDDSGNLRDYKIPKIQLDHVLQNRTRYQDKETSKFPKVLIYTACFGREYGNIVAREFNSQDVHKIKEFLIIKDFGYWLEKNEINEDYLILVMLGINPKYYLDNMSEEEQQVVCSQHLVNLSGNGIEWIEIRQFINNFKKESKVLWQNNWNKFIDDLYRKSLTINPYFCKMCKRFVSFLIANSKLPNYFDSYTNEALYEADYDKYFNCIIQDQEDVTLLLLGLEPLYAKRYFRRGDNTATDEEIFFYAKYKTFLEKYDISYAISYKITELKKLEFDGSLESFLTTAYNQGFVIGERLSLYLRQNNLFPKLSKDEGWVLEYCAYWASKSLWSLEEIVNLLIKGKITHNYSEKKFQFLDHNKALIVPLEKSESINVYDKNGNFEKFFEIIKKDLAVGKIEAKIIDGVQYFEPQKIIEWFQKYTQVKIPDQLVEALEYACPAEVAQEDIIEKPKSGKKKEIDDVEIWQKFIEEKLEGVFNRKNRDFAQQAYLAYNALTETKKKNLNYFNEKSRSFKKQAVLIDVEELCKKYGLRGKKTSLSKYIISPFIEKFSKNSIR